MKKHYLESMATVSVTQCCIQLWVAWALALLWVSYGLVSYFKLTLTDLNGWL